MAPGPMCWIVPSSDRVRPRVVGTPATDECPTLFDLSF
eukprot:CAMPEP_0117742106 /NCGR_PEP_ID=MMETSP0947-20121206/5341_1 /TAXON_ID=44440 /ORGANISM="Chattonella subsalsa, Strain CCMP2191" /LENGTH=37 /DNA_ID= /DNA_START= /DNA_END= /DNA_ORIENTATION=